MVARMVYPLPFRRATFRTAFCRVLAIGLAALVLVLGLLTVSPDAHAWLHDHDDREPAHDSSHAAIPASSEDSGCVVFAFAHGVSLASTPILSLWLGWARPLFAASREHKLYLASPRYLWQPERGPPLS